MILGTKVGRKRDKSRPKAGQKWDTAGHSGTKVGQNQDKIEKEINKTKKMEKQKGGLRGFFLFIFIIMAYLLTIGSRGRHKALCRPRKV